MASREMPKYWGVFEREPAMGSQPNNMIFGTFPSKEGAEAAKIKWVNTDNYFVSQSTPYGELING